MVRKKTHKVIFTDTKGVKHTVETSETVAQQMKNLEGNKKLPWITRVSVRKKK